MEGDYVIVYYIINNLLLQQITETYELLLFKPRVEQKVKSYLLLFDHSMISNPSSSLFVGSTIRNVGMDKTTNLTSGLSTNPYKCNF